ncbi:hypothetical protein HPP92_023931 [Vanilla planifolia]|uniref:CCT domain-containing protein n=1 Tax=Vanilla planifolia TaxID=51239 RepID=A0A835UCG5_VANPL|nr:hypothetical protein HPP92_023931 [Vanilla planifolia]
MTRHHSEQPAAAWHHRVTRKRRTKRRQHHLKPVVPELEMPEEDDGLEELLLYRVPVFDPDKPLLSPSSAHETEKKGVLDAKQEAGCGGGCLAEMKLESKEDARDGSFDFEPTMVVAEEEKQLRSGLALRLNYEAVVAAWSPGGRSPWASGERPKVNPAEYWLECMGMGIQVMQIGREARVTRYREKKRTRLFVKKIRYEVRKLNAEKRPRMKGRFVKRASNAAAAATTSCASGGGVAFAC